MVGDEEPSGIERRLPFAAYQPLGVASMGLATWGLRALGAGLQAAGYTAAGCTAVGLQGSRLHCCRAARLQAPGCVPGCVISCVLDCVLVVSLAVSLTERVFKANPGFQSLAPPSFENKF